MLRPSSNRQPCPICKAQRGLAVDVGRSGKLIYFCHANNCDVAAWAKANGDSPPERPTMGEDYTSPAEQEYQRLRRALAILRAAAEANAGAPVDYLRARGIDGAPPCAMLMPAKVSRKVIDRAFPAMVVPVTDASGALRGAQVTLLSRDGTKRIKGKKFTYGKVGGGFVRLGEVDPDRPLLAGEGIETVLSAMEIADLPGIAALGTSGLKNVNVPECAEVIILADADPAGQEAAKALADRIAGKRPVRIAEPPPGCSDWNDALRAADADVTALRRAIVKAPRAKARARLAVLSALTAEEFVDLDIPPTQHFLDPILPVSGATVFSGPKGNGKTRVVLSIAETIARGGQMLDWASQRQGRVLYVDGELAEGLVKTRLERLRPTDGKLFVLSRYQQKNAGANMTKLTDPAMREAIDRIMDENRIDVLILDSFSSLVGESENDIEYWADIEDWIMAHRGRGRGILLVMHEGVATGRARGLTRIRDNFDNVMRTEQVADMNAEDEDYFHFKIELLLLREEDSVAHERRQIARIPRVGPMEWEFVRALDPPQPGRPGGRNAERDAKIREMRAGGTPVEDIAAQFELSEERIRQIVRDEEKKEKEG